MVSKWVITPNISHLQVGYNPCPNHLLTSWDIQVVLGQSSVVHYPRNLKPLWRSHSATHHTSWSRTFVVLTAGSSPFEFNLSQVT